SQAVFEPVRCKPAQARAVMLPHLQTHGQSVGRFIGPYLIGGQLGSSGAGTVYAGLHVDLERPVAIKVLSAERGWTPRRPDTTWAVKVAGFGASKILLANADDSPYASWTEAVTRMAD